jgi:hypothetical protein
VDGFPRYPVLVRAASLDGLSLNGREPNHKCCAERTRRKEREATFSRPFREEIHREQIMSPPGNANARKATGRTRHTKNNQPRVALQSQPVKSHLLDFMRRPSLATFTCCFPTISPEGPAFPETRTEGRTENVTGLETRTGAEK